MRKLVTKKNIYLIILLVISLLGLVISPTYAKFPSNYVTDNDMVGMSLDFNIGITNIEEYEEIIVAAGTSEQFNIEIENISTETMYYGVWYKMIKPTDITEDILIGRLEDTEITTSGSVGGNSNKIVTIGIINNSNTDIKINVGVSSSITSTSDIEYLDGRKLITGTVEIDTSVLLSDYIQNLYNDGSSINTVNIGGSTDNPTVSLNATQGLMLDNNGEYRYYGANPNNYVQFNDELWRIISVSNVKSSTDDTEGEMRVKIIRNESIGNYSWDSSDSTINSGKGVNDWSQADLNTILNDLYYNREEGICYTSLSNKSTSCSFVTTGLSDDAQDEIDTALWYLGASSTDLSNVAYNSERSTTVYNCSTNDGACPRSTTWDGIVGLMYPSDYGYATNLSVCTEKLENYYSDDCKNNNWMYDSGSYGYQRILSPTSGHASYAFSVILSGYVYYNYVFDAQAVRPVVYLRSDVMITGGTGTSTDPYIIS